MNTNKKPSFSKVPGLISVHAAYPTTTSGTLGTATKSYGMTLTKTGSKTGRYTCQLVDHLGNAVTALALVGALVNIVGPDDTAMTDAKGVWLGTVRDDDIATDGTVEIQFQDGDSMADAEVQDGASIKVTLFLQDKNY